MDVSWGDDISMDLADGVYIAANWRDISNYFEYSYSNNSGNG